MILKTLAGILATPLLVALLAGLVGVVARLLAHRTFARWCFGIGAAVGYACATPAMGDFTLGSLERRFGGMAAGQPLPDVPYVVVLGNGYSPRDDVPITGALADEALARIVEGVRLTRLLPNTKLVVSGGAPKGGVPCALGYALLAAQLGVSESSIVTIPEPVDTAGEARALAQRIGNASFILVTSASHMPRALRFMERQGLHAIPAPTAQRVDTRSRAGLVNFIPSAAGLRKTELALHEYLGLAALRAGAQ